MYAVRVLFRPCDNRRSRLRFGVVISSDNHNVLCVFCLFKCFPTDAIYAIAIVVSGSARKRDAVARARNRNPPGNRPPQTRGIKASVGPPTGSDESRSFPLRYACRGRVQRRRPLAIAETAANIHGAFSSVRLIFRDVRGLRFPCKRNNNTGFRWNNR